MPREVVPPLEEVRQNIKKARRDTGVLIEKVGDKTARFLSDFGSVMTTLFLYLLVCLITYICLAVSFGSARGEAWRIAFDVSTGGEPYNHDDALKHFPTLWMWLHVVHVLSWLIVPVLAATAIDAAYRIPERKKGKAERRILRGIRKRGRAEGLTGSELDSYVAERFDELLQLEEEIRS